MKRSVVITQPAHLSKKRNQLRIAQGDEEHLVPIEDLGILVIDHDAVEVTGILLGNLCEAGVVTVFANDRHLPAGLLIPMENNALLAQTLRGQIAASAPTKKRLWQSIIQEKIRSQSRLLQDKVGHDADLGALAREVRSGDSTNREGLAASIYFEALFGGGFARLRQRQLEAEEDEYLRGINACLNYGYAILRSAVARAVIGAGMTPALGVFHRHRNNAFALVDDLMEPLRVLVDREVYQLQGEGLIEAELNPGLKRRLVSILACEVYWNSELCPLDVALSSYSAEVRRCLLGEVKNPRIPSA
jgi:CRISPR-associated protein Cas1